MSGADLCLSCRWSIARYFSQSGAAQLTGWRVPRQELVCVNRWQTGRQRCQGYEYEPGTDASEANVDP
jgi:hypothetical protein